MNEFATRVNPRRFNFSLMMVAIVGAVIQHDYGIRDARGGRLTALHITSDGFLLASTTSHDSGLFLGTGQDFDRNLSNYLTFLTNDDRERFARLYSANVTDWRQHVQ
jgi:hypothetical protein